MLHLGDTLNDVRWRHAGLYLSGVLYSVMGKFTKACVYSEDALSLWDPDFRTFADSPEDPDVSVRLYYHRALLCLGHLDKARLFRNEALAEARRALTVQRGLCSVSFLARRLGNARSGRSRSDVAIGR